ncbi:MAG TPA: ATP-binding protein [Dongiaceae bacterium]|nr:ATP-binding protein [Dongiaceae bacterium]
MSAAEFKSGKLILPQMLAEPRFNQLQSGLFASVVGGGEAVWLSQSYLGKGQFSGMKPDPGTWIFDEFNEDGEHFYRMRFTVIWEYRKKELPFIFVVWETGAPYEAQIRGFETTLWSWLGGLIVASVVITFLLLYWGFRPFSALAAEVTAIENGERDAVDGRYPAEVVPIVINLNRLLGHERKLRERYKNSLGDLAHSLKTPLAVMRGLDLSDPDKSTPLLQQQISRMDEIVSYQLRRALSTAPALASQGVPLQELVQKLTAVLQKVYADQPPQFETNLADGIRIPCEEGDAFELLGNLLDNACKHGASPVRISASNDERLFRITVEDSGGGIAPEDREAILQRGVRRDEQAPGQGIGLAVVADIVSAYGGELEIDRSTTLGGACFRIRLPR